MPQRLPLPSTLWCFLGLLLWPFCTWAADLSQLKISADGHTVTDPGTRLVWARCVEGMQWRGRGCEGQALLLTRAQAQSVAAMHARQTGVPWRLPTARELERLSNRQAHHDSRRMLLFPQAPLQWHWSSSVPINTRSVNQYDYGNVMQGASEQNVNRINVHVGAAVHWGDGVTQPHMPRKTTLPVRLLYTMPN
jgi:hypothetical protein